MRRAALSLGLVLATSTARADRIADPPTQVATDDQLVLLNASSWIGSIDQIARIRQVLDQRGLLAKLPQRLAGSASSATIAQRSSPRSIGDTDRRCHRRARRPGAGQGVLPPARRGSIHPDRPRDRHQRRWPVRRVPPRRAHQPGRQGRRPRPADPPGGVDAGVPVDGPRGPAAPVAILRNHARSPVRVLRSLASRVNSVLVLVSTRI